MEILKAKDRHIHIQGQPEATQQSYAVLTVRLLVGTSKLPPPAQWFLVPAIGAEPQGRSWPPHHTQDHLRTGQGRFREPELEEPQFHSLKHVNGEKQVVFVQHGAVFVQKEQC